MMGAIILAIFGVSAHVAFTLQGGKRMKRRGIQFKGLKTFFSL